MVAKDESENVGNISNEAVKDIAHAALLKGMGKMYHKPDVNFIKIKCMPRLKIASNRRTLCIFLSVSIVALFFIVKYIVVHFTHVHTHTHTYACTHTVLFSFLLF
jgi:hypothetical protein